MLTPEQANQIKEHLLKQLDKFPEDQREIVKNKITSMTEKELEEFVQQNNLTHLDKKDQPEQKCIFCAIIKEQIKSYKISEDKDYVAILELNPLSKGHSLVLPKTHINLDNLNENILDFAKKVSENISEKLSPKEIKFSKNEILEHAMLEIIPIYGNEKEKHKATDEELIELQKILTEKKSEKEKPEPKEESEKPIEKKPEPLPKIKLRTP